MRPNPTHSSRQGLVRLGLRGVRRRGARRLRRPGLAAAGLIRDRLSFGGQRVGAGRQPLGAGGLGLGGRGIRPCARGLGTRQQHLRAGPRSFPQVVEQVAILAPDRDQLLRVVGEGITEEIRGRAVADGLPALARLPLGRRQQPLDRRAIARRLAPPLLQRLEHQIGIRRNGIPTLGPADRGRNRHHTQHPENHPAPHRELLSDNYTDPHNTHERPTGNVNCAAEATIDQ